MACWGTNAHGQIDAPDGHFIDAAVGNGLSCGLRRDGTVECWGLVPPMELLARDGRLIDEIDEADVRFTAISTGSDARSSRLCGLSTQGSLHCAPIGLESREASGPLRAVSVGEGLWCVLHAGGAAQCWHHYGSPHPDTPEGRFDTVSAGDNHACGVRAVGTLKCWGVDYGGLLDSPSGQFTAVSTATNHTCAVRTTGALECWGLDYAGLLDSPGGQFNAVSTAINHSCAIRTEGTIECWGTFRTPPVGVTHH